MKRKRKSTDASYGSGRTHKNTNIFPNQRKTTHRGVDWANSNSTEIVINIPEFIQTDAADIDIMDYLDISIELENSSMEFGRDLEEYIEHQLEEVLTETLSSSCFYCEVGKMYDDDDDEYYCPMCNR